jgi:hypothetical protein
MISAHSLALNGLFVIHVTKKNENRLLSLNSVAYYLYSVTTTVTYQSYKFSWKMRMLISIDCHFLSKYDNLILPDNKVTSKR